MGEALSQICIAEPLSSETYDSKDNMLIVTLIDGDRAFAHFAGGCDINTMMFASSVEGGEKGCVSTGDVLTFSGSFGSKACKIAAINRWLQDEPISEYDTPY